MVVVDRDITLTGVRPAPFTTRKLHLRGQETPEETFEGGGDGRQSFWYHGGRHVVATNEEYGSSRSEFHGLSVELQQ